MVSFYAVYRDIKIRRINNTILLGLLVICVLIATDSGFEWRRISQFFIVLLVGLLLYRLNILAAGDSKVLACYSIAIDSYYWPLTIVMIMLVGGLFVIGYFVVDTVFINKSKAKRGYNAPYLLAVVPISLVSIYLSIERLP